MIKEHKMPADVLRNVFTPEVLEKLRSQKNPTQRLLGRIDVLTANGSEPLDPWKRERFRMLRKWKAAWDAYLTAAFAIGLFDGKNGEDLRSRLRAPDDENFRSGIAECMAAWFLAGKQRLPVRPRPIGQKGPLEFSIKQLDGDIYAEVKAPYAPILDRVTFSWGDDSHLLQRAIESANKQFNDGVRNLLVIVPNFRIPVHILLGQITRAFFGDMSIRIPIDTGSGGPAGVAANFFKPSGHLLATRLPSEKPFKPDNSPRFTRVSAILCIEEVPGVQSIEYSVLVVHNPYAQLSISEGIWGGLPQFVRRGDQMIWTDGGSPWP